MTLELSKNISRIGMIGLGVMGRNLLLNMADHGFPVAGYDTDPAQVKEMREVAGNRDVRATSDIGEFLGWLTLPRAILVLVPAGAPVDSVLAELSGRLQAGDLILDGGNSYYKDTDNRLTWLAEKGIDFLGVGISGGKEGARHGPSIMPGGSEDAYQHVRPILEAVAAKVGDEPCVTWLGPGSAGHYVKMVHNGIEYGLMQLIAEAYQLMKCGLGLDDDSIGEVFSTWNEGGTGGYLIGITSRIFFQRDAKTDLRIIDEILDVAKQKGTGMWTSQSASELQVPVPILDSAVSMRAMSGLAGERERAAGIYGRPIAGFDGEGGEILSILRGAFHVAMILTFGQGFALLSAASKGLGYALDLSAIARIWRGGCIIRAELLEVIRNAFLADPGLPNLLLDSGLAGQVLQHQEDLRAIVLLSVRLGLPVPALMASLGYLDSYGNAWLPANLIQAQRDFFGSHTYERIDAKGSFHTQWVKA